MPRWSSRRWSRRNGPLAVRAILRTIRETEGLAENDAFGIEAEIGMAVFMSDDAKEGPRAFAAKRKPVFQDRYPSDPRPRVGPWSTARALGGRRP